MDEPAYLTTKEAAAYLRISTYSLEIARHQGGGPAYLQPIPRGRVVYRRDDLDAWLESGRKASTSAA